MIKVENYSHILSSKIISEIESHHIFKYKCFQYFSFLIDDFSFNKVEIEDFGKEIEFKFKNINQGLMISVIHELGVLPYVKIDSRHVTNFIENNNLSHYPAHNELQMIIRNDNNPVKEYIKLLGKFWKDKSKNIDKEIEECLDDLANQTRIIISSSKIS